MERKVKLSISTAREMYIQGSAAKLFALDNYSENELNPDIIQRIKTYKDVCKELGICERKKCDYISEKMFRFQQIQDIQEVFNEGWKPDWKNRNEYKYYPYFEFLLGGGVRFSCSISGLCWIVSGQVSFYKNKKISDYIGNTFLDIYKAFILG